MKGIDNTRILVVDDDPKILKLYERIFANQEQQSSSAGLLGLSGKSNATSTSVDWKLSKASQGEEAVDMVRKATADGTPFAVALVDVRMPPGIDGIEAAQRMREIDPNIYLIIVSAYSNRPVAEMQQVLQSDFLLLRKPFEDEEITQAVTQLALSRNRFKV